MKNPSTNNLEKIRTQIELLKMKLNNIDKTLCLQEKVLNLIDEKTNSLFKETKTSKTTSAHEIMKSAFSGKNIPKILLK